TNTATDPDLPANTLTCSLESYATDGASINPTNGVYTWPATVPHGPSTNLITVRVTDNASPPSTDVRSFTIIVTEVNRPPVLTVRSEERSVGHGARAVAKTEPDTGHQATTVAYTVRTDAPARSI